MESERWQKLEEIYHAALEKSLDEREAFLKQACAGDESLHQEVASLIAEAEITGPFLDVPALHVAAQAIASLQPARESSGTPALPAVIGRYRVIRLLGEGGMGAVYEAAQEEPSRSVALKIIRPGLATPERLRRFRHEFQALGRLQHPGIAQIYEASAADTGFGPQPYFAMELVRGQSLSEYAADKNLTIRQKLALMIKICEAVHHAHERGLIHRDLKPGNILVDDSGQPKILDFGVARVTKAEGQSTMLTEVGQIVGTVAYMSPEQMSGDPHEIDARSDIYSLGVILYELLSGRLPYDVKHRQIHEAVQTIRDSDPTSLSSISVDLRGDVETIVGKALEKDKARRYSSAASFAEDIQRFLNDEPILARAPTTTYQLRKFARRHRVLVGSLAAVFVVLLAGGITSAVLAVRANRAREAAVRDRDRANRITDFTTNMFKVSDPREARGNSITAREVLDKASAGIGKGLEHDPDLQAHLLTVMGVIYDSLGLYSQAQALHERAADLFRRTLGPKSPDTLTSEAYLAYDLSQEGHYPEAEKLSREVLEIQRQVLGSDSSQTLDTMFNLAWILHLEGRYAEAEKLDRETLERRRRILGPENRRTLNSMGNVAVDLGDQGRFAEQEAVLKDELAIERRVLGPESPDTLSTVVNLAGMLDNTGRYADAEKMQRETLGIMRRVLGPEHPDTLRTELNLGVSLQRVGRLGEAEKVFAQVLESERRVLGPDHPDVGISVVNLAYALNSERKFSDAEPLYRQAFEIQRRTIGPENRRTLTTMNDLAGCLMDLGKLAEARRVYEDALAIERRVLSSDDPITLRSVYNLACVAARSARPRDAIALLNEAVDHGLSADLALGMEKDSDLRSLHFDPRFAALVSRAKQRAVGAESH